MHVYIAALLEFHALNRQNINDRFPHEKAERNVKATAVQTD
jgi:hypothetical protein